MTDSEQSASSSARGLHVLPQAEEWLTREEFAGRLGVSVSTVDRWRTAGMPTIPCGMRLVRIREREAVAWLSRVCLNDLHTNKSGPAPNVQ